MAADGAIEGIRGILHRPEHVLHLLDAMRRSGAVRETPSVEYQAASALRPAGETKYKAAAAQAQPSARTAHLFEANARLTSHNIAVQAQIDERRRRMSAAADRKAPPVEAKAAATSEAGSPSKAPPP